MGKERISPSHGQDDETERIGTRVARQERNNPTLEKKREKGKRKERRIITSRETDGDRLATGRSRETAAATRWEEKPTATRDKGREMIPGVNYYTRQRLTIIINNV